MKICPERTKFLRLFIEKVRLEKLDKKTNRTARFHCHFVIFAHNHRHSTFVISPEDDLRCGFGFYGTFEIDTIAQQS